MKGREDFVRLLQAAQDTGEGREPPSRPQKVERDGEGQPAAEPDEGSGAVGGEAVEEASAEEGGDAEDTAGEETRQEDYAPLGQPAAAATEQLLEFVLPDAERGEGTQLEEDLSLEGVVWAGNSRQMRLGKGGEEGRSASETTSLDDSERGAGQPSEGDLPQLPLQGETILDSRSSLDLLTAHELLDPDLVVEDLPAQFAERLHQAMSAESAPGLADDVAEVVVPQVIRGLAALVRNGAAELRLQLQPPDLGEIELRVRTTEATVRGEMMVQRPEVKQLLDGQMDRLRQALAGQGLELEGFDIGVGRDAHFAQDGGSWQREEGDRSRSPAGSRRAVEVPAVEVVPAGVGRGDSAVDYTI